jgi:hypothetical protein
VQTCQVFFKPGRFKPEGKMDSVKKKNIITAIILFAVAVGFYVMAVMKAMAE